MKFNRCLFVFATWMTCYTASATDISCGTGFEELGKKAIEESRIRFNEVVKMRERINQMTKPKKSLIDRYPKCCIEKSKKEWHQNATIASSYFLETAISDYIEIGKNRKVEFNYNKLFCFGGKKTRKTKIHISKSQLQQARDNANELLEKQKETGKLTINKLMIKQERLKQSAKLDTMGIVTKEENGASSVTKKTQKGNRLIS